MENISINEFAKVYLCVGEILSCDVVEASSKLYKLEVDLGEHGKRQILAGVRKSFSPEDLIGKQGVYVANLDPRKILDLESQGMMLFAKDENGLHLVTVDSKVENGTRLK
jgi:methionyl-tRNA synthetase